MAENIATEITEKKSLNFIEQAIEKDLKEGKNGGIAYQVREFHVLQMLHYMLGHIWIDPIIASCKRFTYTKTLRE